MLKHMHTEKSEVNFAKLEERIMAINHPQLNKANDMRELISNLLVINHPVLLIATGGSKVVAYYLQMVLEQLEPTGIICEVLEPRDYFYKINKKQFSSLVAISASGNTNGIKEILNDFKGKKFLICENDHEADYQVVSWRNKLYNKELSFISLASSLGPITLMLDATTSLNLKIVDSQIIRINHEIKKVIDISNRKISCLPFNFKNTNLIQIISGYDTKCASSVLESNLVEAGLCTPIIHDKGSFCHGRSNLIFQYPDSHIIYLCHHKSELDKVLLDTISNNYSNISIFDTHDFEWSYFWKEYYLLIQMYFLSKKIADDKNIDLTQPEYNPQVVGSLYNFKGD